MIKIKKIAFIVTGIYHASGISSITATIANELIKDNNLDITLITLSKRSEKKYVQLDKNIKIEKVFDENVDLKRNILKISSRLNTILKDNEYDIVISSTLIFWLLKLSVSNIKKKPALIAWEHATIPTKKNILSTSYFMRKIAAEKSDALVVITKGATVSYKKTYNNINKLLQIYNTKNNLGFLENNYDIDSKKIISVGSLIPQKGFDIAIEVSKIIFEKNPEWEWHIYGEGKDKKKLNNLIKEYGLEKKIILMGNHTNIEELYNQYSFFVLTSRHEPFGLVIIEAQDSLLPIISFDIPYGPPELVNDGVNGLLTEAFNTNDMANNIQYLIDNDYIRKKMSANSQMFFKKLDKDKIVSKWRKLINEL